MDRRRMIAASAAGALIWGVPLSATAAAQPFVPLGGTRSRVLFVNDLSGDIDGLFAAVHMILSPSVELRGIVGTSTGDAGETAEVSAALATEILELMGMTGRTRVHVGAGAKLAAPGRPVSSPGSQAIIDEAMRADTQQPLYVAVGGGLTEVASAVMLEPRIAGRFTLVWIGGDALPGSAAGHFATGETNFNIDPLAAQYLFNETAVPIWQVTRAAYATCQVSATELQAYVAPYGAIGPWLQDKLFVVTRKYGGRFNTGETWAMGDNPLVLLTALTGWVPSKLTPPLLFERTDSNRYDKVVAPRLNSDGTFTARGEGREIRIYTSVDTRMMFGDFFAKMRMNFGG